MTAKTAPFYGWKLVAVFFFIYFINGNLPFYGASVINARMVTDLGIDRSALGLGFTVFLLSMGLSAPIVGHFVSRFGVRLTLVWGSILLTVAALLMAFVTTEIWHYLLFFGVLNGIGMGAGGILPIQAGITYWFRRRKAFALSIVMSANGISALISAPFLNWIISINGGNWRIGWIFVAAMAVIATFAIAFGVKDRPEVLGQIPDGIDTAKSCLDATQNVQVGDTKVYQSEENWSVAQSIHTLSFWLIVIGYIAFMVPTSVCVAHSVIHLVDIGHSKESAALSMGILVMFSVVGRLLGGFLSDNIEPRKIWSAALIAVVIGIIFLANAEDFLQIVLYALFLGAGYGCAWVCLPTTISNYFGPESFPKIMGVMLPIVTLFSAVAPTAAGLIYDQQGSYQIAFQILIATASLGAVAIVMATPPVRHRPITVPSR